MLTSKLIIVSSSIPQFVILPTTFGGGFHSPVPSVLTFLPHQSNQYNRRGEGICHCDGPSLTLGLHIGCPKHPIVLAHGLLGFAELKLGGSYLPAIRYWRGIKEALMARNAEVITASVPPSGSIEQRAAKLARDIEAQAHGRSVNIIAHSMGGLDARYMVSQLQPASIDVKSLVTVASPHHGSAFADYLFDEIGPEHLPRLYELWERATGWEPGAFSQLTQKYMVEEFNPKTPDDPSVRYFSYGAMVKDRPPLLSPFRLSHGIIQKREGPNDGLVSVESSKWGTYKGTLVGVNHLDLINWSNRLRFTWQKWMGNPPS